jgi:hypothetical protein
LSLGLIEFFTTVKPTLPENFEEETWQKLRAAIHAIHNKQPVATSLEELYKVRHNFTVVSFERERVCE